MRGGEISRTGSTHALIVLIGTGNGAISKGIQVCQKTSWRNVGTLQLLSLNLRAHSLLLPHPSQRLSLHSPTHSACPLVWNITPLPQAFTAPLGDVTNFMLGPPDLVHIVKYTDSGDRCIYCYHYVIGVDVSSSASIAAYINSLVNDSSKSSGNGTRASAKSKSGKGNNGRWRVREVLYCTWNPFTGSRCPCGSQNTGWCEGIFVR